MLAMLTRLSPSLRRLIALSVLILLGWSAVQLTVAPLLGRWQAAWATAEQAAHWQTRLDAAAANAPRLEAELAALGPVPGVLRASGEALAAAELQSLAQDLATAAGAQVLSLEPLPAARDGSILTVRTRLRATLSEDALPDFLAAMARHDPFLFIANLSLAAAARRGPDPATPLQLQAEISAFAVEDVP